MTFDVPDTKTIDLSALKIQMQTILNALISFPSITKGNEPDDIHIFDCLSDDWGGDGDANEIAETIPSPTIKNI